MGGRADKGRSVSRYLQGHSGIVGLSWGQSESNVIAPHPYRFGLTTSRKIANWTDMIAATPDDGTMSFAIRYDYGMGTIDEGWVGMTLRNFVPLLESHYNEHGAYRAQNGE